MFAGNVRARMGQVLGVVTTQHSFEDVLLQNLAYKTHSGAKVTLEVWCYARVFLDEGDSNFDTRGQGRATPKLAY